MMIDSDSREEISGAAWGEDLDEDLIASLGLDELVPAPLAQWRPLVVEAILFFLERLPSARVATIVAEQWALEYGASPARRLAALLARCPTLHKLGQVLARQRSLHPDLRRHLQALESMPPTVPIEPILACIRREIEGMPPVALADFALAEGSVAVVVPFSYRQNNRTLEGVFKLLKPGVRACLAEELAIFRDLAPWLEKRGRELGLPGIDYREHLASVQRLLEREVRLDIEQENLGTAGEFYREDAGILVPRVLPWSTPELIAMERVFGMKATDAGLPGKEGRELADTMVSLLIAKPFWTRNSRTLFHGDLHGGNIFLAADGRLAILDWSLTADLNKVQREALIGVALGGLTLDAEKIRAAIASLGFLGDDDPRLKEVVEHWLDRLVLQGRPPSFEWLLAMLDDLAIRIGASFPGELGLFRKTWLTLSGVITDLAGKAAPDIPLLKVGIWQFIREFPSRVGAAGNDTDYATHVSNAQLYQLLGAPWLIGLRYWARLGKIVFSGSS